MSDQASSLQADGFRGLARGCGALEVQADGGCSEVVWD